MTFVRIFRIQGWQGLASVVVNDANRTTKEGRKRQHKTAGIAAAGQSRETVTEEELQIEALEVGVQRAGRTDLRGVAVHARHVARACGLLLRWLQARRAASACNTADTSARPVEHGAQRLAARPETLRHGADRQARRVEAAADLTPLERRRHRCAGTRPHRERRDDRLSKTVLQKVDVHLAAAFPQWPCHGGDRRLLGDDHARQDFGEGARLGVRQRSAEWDEHVQAVLPGGLDAMRHAELAEQRVRVPRHRHHIAKRRALRVEIEDRPVRPVERGAPRAPHVHRNASQVDHVEECLQLVANEVVGVLDATGLHPFRDEVRRVLLKETLAVNPVRIAREHHRTVAQSTVAAAATPAS